MQHGNAAYCYRCSVACVSVSSAVNCRINLSVSLDPFVDRLRAPQALNGWRHDTWRHRCHWLQRACLIRRSSGEAPATRQCTRARRQRSSVAYSAICSITSSGWSTTRSTARTTTATTAPPTSPPSPSVTVLRNYLFGVTWPLKILGNKY